MKTNEEKMNEELTKLYAKFKKNVANRSLNLA